VKLNYIFSVIVVAMVVGDIHQTGGLIDKRYVTKMHAGRQKESQFTGREDITQNESNLFLNTQSLEQV
jgi:hypothetical protein